MNTIKEKEHLKIIYQQVLGTQDLSVFACGSKLSLSRRHLEKIKEAIKEIIADDFAKLNEEEKLKD